MRRPLFFFIVVCLLLAAAAAVLLLPSAPDETSELDLARVLGTEQAQGFARADRGRDFRFPDDHGPHPRFRTEWWYFTGNLRDAAARRFGYELALFRVALAPGEAEGRSAWATNQVYLGHFALTDAADRRFYYFDRFARGALGLAGARAAPFAVWLEDWSVRAQDDGGWRLQAAAEDVRVDLVLSSVKPIVLQGDRGLSQKSAGAGNASYYYSLPRLATHGTVAVADRSYDVAGLSWMDREWSTSALSDEQAGWDWFALQLSDGYDLMYYQLRRRDGTADAHSQGVLIDPTGRTRRLTADDVAIDVLKHWRSPRGGTYPAHWRVRVARAQLDVEVRPVLADQELVVTPRYWEGAVDVSGTHAGRALTGQGYVELTGYAGARSGGKTR